MSELIKEAVLGAEVELGLPKGFLLRLVRDDDWSFVVKGHALIEASINRLLSERLSEPKLDEFVEALNLGGGRTGKLALVKALELLPDVLFRYIQEFAQLRNSLVHRLDNVQFTFEAYVSRLSEQQKNAFVEWARCGETSDCVVDEQKVSRREYVLSHTKRSITSAFLILMAFIYATKSSIAREKRLAEARTKVSVGLINSVMQAENETQSNAPQQ